MKKLPFTYGTITLLSDFVNREADVKQLSQNFLSGINAVIISPRRWGKSSLVEKTIQTLKDEKDLVICKIDLYNVRSEEDFYLKLANTVLKETASKWEQKKPDDILDLAEKIAEKKGIRIVICLDEFQNIATFGDSLALQKKLRSHFQQHQHVSYCLYGSKRHMLMDVFTNASMPFYKFGNILFLEKIKTEEWVSFIMKRFSDTRKEISEKQAERIVSLVDNHSYYVQQLSQQVWLRTTKKCTDDIVEQAHLSLVQQLSLLFVTLTEGLSNTQINYLNTSTE